jgi:hypothetical protein
VRVFVSYSRRDAGDFAEQIQNRFSNFNQYDIFTDVGKLKAGDNWSHAIEHNISNCDAFIAVVTNGALKSPHVENEVLQAQRENKKIIPCFYKNVRDSDIKWGLNNIQGVNFGDKFELVRNLDNEIGQANIENDKNNDKHTGEKQVKPPYPHLEKRRGFPKLIIGGIGGTAILIIVILSFVPQEFFQNPFSVIPTSTPLSTDTQPIGEDMTGSTDGSPTQETQSINGGNMTDGNTTGELPTS